jgi:hypothetical protein
MSEPRDLQRFAAICYRPKELDKLGWGVDEARERLQFLAPADAPVGPRLAVERLWSALSCSHHHLASARLWTPRRADDKADCSAR